MPSPLSRKSGVFEASVAEHIEGGVAKPAQIALNTDNDSSYPLKVLLLITSEG